MWYIITFIIGVVTGVAGTIVLACLAAAGDADRKEEAAKEHPLNYTLKVQDITPEVLDKLKREMAKQKVEVYCGGECRNHYQCVDCPYYGGEDC